MEKEKVQKIKKIYDNLKKAEIREKHIENSCRANDEEKRGHAPISDLQRNCRHLCPNFELVVLNKSLKIR